MRRLFVPLAIMLALCQTLPAATYYVRRAGNDGNSGQSWAAAWKSIAKINSSIAGGDTVFFGAGVYRGQIIPVSGTANDRTCYACSSFVEGVASIYASDSLGPWTQYNTNVYSASYFQADFIWEENSYMCGQKDATYDTVLTPVATLAEVSSPGRFYHDLGANRIYVWKYGGGSPANSDMEASSRGCVFFNNGQDYVTVWGFNMKYAKGGMVYFHNAATPGANYNHIEHCFMKWSGGWAGGNVGCIEASYGGAHNDPNAASHYNVFRACSFGNVYIFGGPDEDDQHRYGIGWYSMWDNLIESCTVRGPYTTGIGFNLKSECRNNMIRYNTINSPGYNGINFQASYSGDTLCGNVIIGDGNNPTYGITLMDFAGEDASNMSLFNNTIFKCGQYGINTGGSGGNAQGMSWIKYNIIDSMRNQIIALTLGDEPHFTIDSNYYYASGSNFYAGGGSCSWSTCWRTTYGFDLHNSSITTNPGFTNPSAGNFSRPNSTQEMYRTYGGRTWTRYGAWQPGGTPPPQTDSIPPGRINDLGAAPGPGVGQATLTWSATGDDGMTGVADHYEIMWNPDGIDSFNWVADSIMCCPKPPGQPEQAIIRGLSLGRRYFFAVQALDEVGNRSGVSNIVDSCPRGLSPPGIFGREIVDSITGIVNLIATTVTSDCHPVLYQFELDLDSNFNNPKLDTGAVQGTRATATYDGLDRTTLYFWHCRTLAVDGSDSSNWTKWDVLNLEMGTDTGSIFSSPRGTHAFPNPFYLRESSVVTFNLVPEGANLIIMTVSGNTVKRWTNITGGMRTWDGANESGERVASGTYLWSIEGTQIRGKLIVIRD